ncbi:MAG TPA: ABC transporter permease subunit [Thermoanaerobaculia bacterium]|nr:ABC transporter permease subunit [Thermoanaerobaculia bacterium]
MSAVLATFGRELRAYFLSPLAYAVLFFFLLVNGVIFSIIVSYLIDPRVPAGMQPFAPFFGTVVWWQLVLVPLITMRLIAEERRSGSIEVLMTAPATEGQVVTGKFLAALAFYLFLWLPTLAYPAFVELYGEVDWGLVAGGYAGTVLVGAFFLAIGMVTSALTRSQLLAALAGAAVVMLFIFVDAAGGLATAQGTQEAVGYVSVLSHMDELGRGVVDSRRLVFYLSGVVFFLFVAARMLEERKWR